MSARRCHGHAAAMTTSPRLARRLRSWAGERARSQPLPSDTPRQAMARSHAALERPLAMFFLSYELPAGQLGEGTLLFQQLGVRPALDDAAALHDIDPVRVGDGGEAMGDDDARGVELLQAGG